MNAQPSLFSLAVSARKVPCAMWTPEMPARGVVLAGHGGGGHKESEAIQQIVRALLPRGLVVAAIDGPVHGDRRPEFQRDPMKTRQAFREAWRERVGSSEMVQDWSALLDHLQADRGCATLPVGYIGVSMGTAYGLPFLAQDARVRAAALGLWSGNHVSSGHLLDAAARLRCATWFTQQWDDEIFDRAGTLGLFDAIGSPDKRLVVYPGRHQELSGERLDDAVAFVVARLAAAS